MNTTWPQTDTTLKPELLRQIAEEYYNSLEIPAAAKRAPQFCICVIGLVGAGKSTVLKKIAAQLPVVRVSGDEIRRLLKSKGLPTDDTVYIADHVFERLKLKDGYNVAHDSDSARPIIRELLRKNNRDIIKELWIRVAPPESFIVNKLKSYNHTWLFNDADHALKVYHERKALHESLPDLNDLPYMYTFDTSRADLDNQVDEFVAKARHELGYN